MLDLCGFWAIWLVLLFGDLAGVKGSGFDPANLAEQRYQAVGHEGPALKDLVIVLAAYSEPLCHLSLGQTRQLTGGLRIGREGPFKSRRGDRLNHRDSLSYFLSTVRGHFVLANKDRLSYIGWHVRTAFVSIRHRDLGIPRSNGR